MSKAVLATILVLNTAMYAVNANASCAYFYPGNKPAIPSGDTATYAQMLEVRDQVQHYIDRTEKRLAACPQIDSMSHNFHVLKLEHLAEGFNASLADFRARQTP